MEKKQCTAGNLNVALDFMKAGKCAFLIVLINVSMAVVLLQTPVSVSLAGVDPTVPVHVIVSTGDPTAVAAASARMELCATPSLEPATVLLDSRDGGVRNTVTKGHTGMTASKSASARMEPPVIM